MVYITLLKFDSCFGIIAALKSLSEFNEIMTRYASKADIKTQIRLCRKNSILQSCLAVYNGSENVKLCNIRKAEFLIFETPVKDHIYGAGSNTGIRANDCIIDAWEKVYFIPFEMDDKKQPIYLKYSSPVGNDDPDDKKVLGCYKGKVLKNIITDTRLFNEFLATLEKEISEINYSDQLIKITNLDKMNLRIKLTNELREYLLRYSFIALSEFEHGVIEGQYYTRLVNPRNIPFITMTSACEVEYHDGTRVGSTKTDSCLFILSFFELDVVQDVQKTNSHKTVIENAANRIRRSIFKAFNSQIKLNKILRDIQNNFCSYKNRKFYIRTVIAEPINTPNKFCVLTQISFSKDLEDYKDILKYVQKCIKSTFDWNSIPDRPIPGFLQ